MPDSFLTTTQAAEYLTIAAATLNKRRSTGIYPIPYIKLGRSVRYRQADLDAYVEEQRQTSTAENGLITAS